MTIIPLVIKNWGKGRGVSEFGGFPPIGVLEKRNTEVMGAIAIC